VGSIPSTLTTLYTVPVGATAVLRDLELFINTAASALFYIGIDVSGVIVPLIGAGTGTALSHVQWQGRVVLNPGQTVVANSGGANLVGAVSGYLFL
jgi:hypothetical protein